MQNLPLYRTSQASERRIVGNTHTNRFIIRNADGDTFNNSATTPGECLDWAEDFARMGTPGDWYEAFDTEAKTELGVFHSE